MANRFVQLDALRFFFAVIVVLGHAFGFEATLVNGGFAVDFFFILSGFVLSHALIGRPSSAAGFAWARLARLYPLHLVTLAWIVVIVLRTVPQDLIPAAPELAVHLTMLQGLAILGKHTWNQPSWSISIELIVNILLFYPIVRARSVAAATACVVGAYAAILVIWGPLFNGFSIQRIGSPLLSGGLLRGVGGILLGYLLYEAHLALKRRLAAGTGFRRAATAIESAGLCILGLSMAIDSPVLHYLPVPISALLILQMATVPGAVSRALGTRFFAALGDISFSIYLLHTPLLITFGAAGLITLDTRAGSFFAWALYLVMLVPLSFASFRYIERPLQRRLMRHSGWWRTSTATS